MGMFDRVLVECPKCGKTIEFQSKAAACCLVEYKPAKVPTDIAKDIIKEFEVCNSCGTLVVVVNTKPEPKHSILKAVQSSPIKQILKDATKYKQHQYEMFNSSFRINQLVQQLLNSDGCSYYIQNVDDFTARDWSKKFIIEQTKNLKNIKFLGTVHNVDILIGELPDNSPEKDSPGKNFRRTHVVVLTPKGIGKLCC